jgi:hypothetical protein
MIMKYKGVEYTVVQMVGGTGWRWEVTFGAGKNKSGVTAERQSKRLNTRSIAS